MIGIRIFKTLISLSLVLCLCLDAFPTETDTAHIIDKEIARLKDELIKTRRFIHMNPELGNKEFETGGLVASKLMALGFEVQTGVAKTGVVALLRGGNPGVTIGCRADMDALPIQEMTGLPFQSLNPGVMHACGHDIHTTVVLGTAMVMHTLKNRLKGNIKFIFQPAEEGPPPVYNHPELAKVMLPYLYQVAGEPFVNPVVPLMVSEDFACYCEKIPGFFFFLGVKPPESDRMAPLHSQEFNPDERSIPLGIRIMSHLLFNALEHQSHAEDAT